MPIPRNYGVAGEGAIAAYNYTDIAEGTGVVIFQGFSTNSSGVDFAARHKLTASSGLYSTAVETSRSSGDNPSNFLFDLSPFNMPQTIKGTAIVRYSSAVTGGGTKYVHSIITFQKIKLDSSVVDIASVYRQRFSSGGATTIENTVLDVVLPKTHFKKGESLRVQVYMWVSADATCTLAHDPANRSGTVITPASTYPTKFEVHVPFKLDL